MPVDLRPHQVEGVAKMHNGCILYGDVGVGKTITSLAYYFTRVCGGELNKWGSMQTPKDVYVITTAKVRDTKGFEVQAAAMGVHTDPAISTNGVKITVDSWNNLHKYVEVKDAFFIFDEQRVVGYGAWARAFIKIAKSNGWILLSATPGDTWLDYIPVFIANGWYRHKTDFLDQHVIWTPRVKYPKVLRYQGIPLLVKRRNQVLVHMPYERHTTRHSVDVRCDFDEDAFERAVKKRWHVFEKRPIRDVAELFIVMRRIVNSDHSRLENLQELMKKHPKLIVFYNFDYELEMLRQIVPGFATSTTLATETRADAVQTDAGLSHSATSSPNPSESSSLSKSSSSSSADSSTSSSTRSKSSGSRTSSDPNWEYLLSPEGLAANCQGHWTEDQGEGEEFYTCQESSSAKCATVASTATVVDASTGELKQSLPNHPSVSSLVGSSSTASTSHLSGSSESEGLEKTSGGLEPKTRSVDSELSTKEPENIEPSSKPSTFAIAEWNGHKHEEIPKTDSWLYLVQYRAGAEGWNCVETDAMVFYSQTYSYRDWWQAHGRIDRLNTPFRDLWYYHLISRSLIDKAIRAALKRKKSFNERDLDLK